MGVQLEGEVLLLTKSGRLRGEVERVLPEGCTLRVADDPSSVVSLPGVVLLDLDTLTIAPLGRLRESAFVITITGNRGARHLIESMTFGAFDCLLSPIDGEKLSSSIGRALGIRRELEGEPLLFPREGGSGVTCAIVGDSPMLHEVCKMVGAVGRVDVPVLITGESGTGKDLVAESIWKVSTRWEKPFVVLNCASIPESLLEAELFGYERGSFTGAVASRRGKFEEADGGTIFLDEIGDMSLPLQAKVLRVLQNGSFHRIGGDREIRVDVRVIAATNKPLHEMVRKGRFREDLYFRINVVHIHLPPLRERKEDIPLLVECFVRRHGVGSGKDIRGVTGAFLSRLMQHDWPGNIRELENAVRKAIVFARAPYLTSYDLDGGMRLSTHDLGSRTLTVSLRETIRSMLSSPSSDGSVHASLMRDVERVLIEEALTQSGWNKSLAARRLGINRLTLRRKIEELGLEPPQGV
jgi:two-component system nitrogen regulation response regulator GlnG